jgi:cytochrome P450
MRFGKCAYGERGLHGRERAVPNLRGVRAIFAAGVHRPIVRAGFMSFIGVTDIQHPRQSGGAFSFSARDGTLPPDFAERMRDFDLYCEYLGKRIRERRAT